MGKQELHKGREGLAEPFQAFRGDLLPCQVVLLEAWTGQSALNPCCLHARDGPGADQIFIP